MSPAAGMPWARRARLLLGTLVEVGFSTEADTSPLREADTFSAIWRLLQDIQSQLSVFDPESDLSRLHGAAAGVKVAVREHTAQVLQGAREWADESAGRFDLARGTGSWHWDGQAVWRDSADTRLDAGGLAKGYAIDQAVALLRERGWASGWVNAGGDLRVYGPLRLPLVLRDEHQGGTRPWAWLQDGAAATSHFGAGARSRLHTPGAAGPVHPHLSVLAPSAMAADALTKILAQTTDGWHAGLARHGAEVFFHAPAPAAGRTEALAA